MSFVANCRLDDAADFAQGLLAATGDQPARSLAAGEVVVLTTYTAMLSLRDTLARMGYVRQFWED